MCFCINRESQGLFELESCIKFVLDIRYRVAKLRLFTHVVHLLLLLCVNG
jgi:hypothetical protein